MLSDYERDRYYDKHQIPPEHRAELEAMRLESPARKVGKSALANAVTLLFSEQMGRHLATESRTCEAFGFMLQHFEQRVIEIYPQARMMRVERFSSNGHRTTEPITVDALMYTPGGVILLECKYESELLRLSAQNPLEWQRTESGWARPAAQRWAAARGCRYEIFSPTRPAGRCWANLEVLYPLLNRPLNPADERLAAKILDRCAQAPVMLSELHYGFPSGSMGVVLVLLATRRLHGTVWSGLLNRPESFWVSTDRDRIGELDQTMLARQQADLAPIEVKDPLLIATAMDYRRAQLRLDRVNAMINGNQPVSRRYRPLVKRVRAAIAAGRSPLAECLTSFHRSGNHEPRLLKTQVEAMEHVINQFWDRGQCARLDDLHSRLRRHCADVGITDTPSKQSLARAIKRRSSTRHDLATGGNRRYHANKPPSDPVSRSVRAIGFMHMVHIDATKFDNRSAATTCPELPFSCPVLYSAIDQATGTIVGRSLTFGSASRFGLALLLRDIVDRYGQLPLCITMDRGSEGWSEMIVAFAAAYAITLVMRPAGAGRFGSEIENALREINTNIAHRLIGSTLADQKGRASDAKFRSYKTARLAFEHVVEAVDYFLFQVWPDRPIGELGGSPAERYAEAMELGVAGRAVSYNFDFELATSVPIERDRWRVRKERSLRVLYRPYSSPDLSLLLREQGRPDEVRLDCADPSRCYVKFKKRWICAFTSDVLTQQVNSKQDRVFARLFTQDRARENRARKEVARDRTLDRVDLANASQPATRNVQPRTHGSEDFPPPATTEAPVSQSSPWEFEVGETSAFEEVSDA